MYVAGGRPSRSADADIVAAEEGRRRWHNIKPVVVRPDGSSAVHSAPARGRPQMLQCSTLPAGKVPRCRPGLSTASCSQKSE